MKKISSYLILLISVLSLSNIVHADDSYKKVAEWLTALSATQFNMEGDAGCNDFNIVFQEGSLTSFFFANFGEAREQPTPLLLNDNTRGTLVIKKESSDILSYEYVDPPGMIEKAHTIRVEIVTKNGNQLSSLKIRTKTGIFGRFKKIHCR